MSKTYAAPELIAYGSVAGLTASFVKCTPHPDSQGWGHTHAEQGDVIVDPDEHDDHCLPKGRLRP
ncbi:MAG: hypothetical protein HY682_03130 [Chloroflexi bacterium]|nr:hypothetical protein [Chloroflexota bacterium]